MDYTPDISTMIRAMVFTAAKNKKQYASAETINEILRNDLDDIISAVYIRIAESAEDKPLEHIAMTEANNELAKRLHEYKRDMSRTISIDEETESARIDAIYSQSVKNGQTETRETLLSIFDCCADETDKFIISRLYLRDTQTDIARMLGVTTMTIWRRMTNIKQRLLTKIAA